MEVGYQKNEWIVVYVDADGERQIRVFDLYHQAVGFTNELYEKHIPFSGAMTTRFYNHYVEKIIEE